MNQYKYNRRLTLLCLAIAAMLIPALLIAAEGRTPNSGGSDASQETVEMFSAMEKGQIAVKLIPKDSTQCHILIENKTDKPLTVKLPETFAGVPVLAQRAAGGGGGTRTGGTSTTGGGNQSMGGGMSGMGGMGGGMGMFNVAPEKVGKFNVTTVCLEHGKGEPNERIPYEIKPLESVANKPAVMELCRSLGTGQIDQRAAQAAAWFLNNDMTWQELAAKRYRHANGTLGESYFSPQQIQLGMQLAKAALRVADEKQQQNQSADSLNQPATGHP
ncbi:MAG: hypothetical protein ABSG67_07445 [Thermoguttaceae bacterium]|jgi:hypothetical protein